MRSILMFMSLLALLPWSMPSSAAEPLPAPKGPVLLTISGKIEQTNAPGMAQFDQEMLEAFKQASLVTRSALSNTPQRYEGVPLRAVLDRVGAKGKVMKASALNAYEADIPFADLQYEPILAMRIDGQLLTMRDKGPVWVVYPRDAYSALQDVRYDARWVWQLKRLHID